MVKMQGAEVVKMDEFKYLGSTLHINALHIRECKSENSSETCFNVWFGDIDTNKKQQAELKNAKIYIGSDHNEQEMVI